ncbi:MAG TPA: type IV secretion system DNA-binding domain-containing protein [Anaerolineae bacterium]|nr:type IV secretion system DNA-binding domain-containing protein [Anaerolineae bacterium]
MSKENNQFYLGKLYNLKKGEILEKPLHYDPPDLTTHAIVTGMTGSGKTGLCVGLLEEAALKGIPAIVIDPKGDLTNLVLHFPDLSPEDFKPWIDPDYARRKHKSLPEMASQTASMWRKGLKDWGLGSKNISALKNSVKFAIYTPGSSYGIPVNILASFSAPALPWRKNEEALREKISSIITAILTLIGLKNIDPLQSREHILLSNIIEHSWRKGKSLNLQDLIMQTQEPSLEKMGAFTVNKFFPKKDRADLAILLNNFLASPSFQSWIEGQPLEISQLLKTANGKPRHSIFYLAHLNDTERMFFVTLLFAAIESWMRHQRGTGNLRLLVYFDEILGYLPPIANPPSKPLMIRLIKQARAFGVGLMLTTQNPVDVDYKALSNAGTWMVGKLQTDQDKQRLLDGLEGAAGGVKRSEYDQLISALKKRVFLYHNVHEKKPQVFHTRWVMNYLAGPLTRTQIPALNKLAGAVQVKVKKTIEKSQRTTITQPASQGKQITGKPSLPVSVKEYFLSKPADQESAQYRPALIAIAEVNFFSRSPSINTSHTITTLVTMIDKSGQDWESNIDDAFDFELLINKPIIKAKFTQIPDWLKNPAWWKAQEKDFKQWIYETYFVSVHVNKILSIKAGPDVSKEEFQRQCVNAAKEKIEVGIKKLENKLDKKKLSLQNKIERQELRVNKYKDEMKSRRMEMFSKGGQALINLALKKKVTGLSSSLTKRRMLQQAEAKLKEAQQVQTDYQEEMTALQQELVEEKQAVKDKWMEAADEHEEIKLTPTKQKIRVEVFGVAWLS